MLDIPEHGAFFYAIICYISMQFSSTFYLYITIQIYTPIYIIYTLV